MKITYYVVITLNQVNPKPPKHLSLNPNPPKAGFINLHHILALIFCKIQFR